jgi:two-component system response regulator MtrA
MTGPVVVIDDERDVLDVVCDVLAYEGFPVVCLQTPPSPERLLADSRPSVFVIDIMLPGTSGIAVAKELRADGFPHTPMVAMSASKQMIAAAEKTGLFQETLSKPFDLDELVRLIARLSG